jgi:hypothetical protein
MELEKFQFSCSSVTSNPSSFFQFDIESGLFANLYFVWLIAHAGHSKMVLGIFDSHGEITVHVGRGVRHDTVLAVYLHHGCHIHRVQRVFVGAFRHVSRDSPLSLCPEEG